MRGVLYVRRWAPWSILIAAVLAAASASAQTTPSTDATPELTEEQLQILQDLPPEQRDALIDQYLKSRI